MLHLTNRDARVCVIGRCDFGTDAGIVTQGVAEALSRSFATCLLPVEPALRASEAITLPNGRRLPVCRDPGQIAVSFFCDTLWDHTRDALLPPGGLKIACLFHDADELPPRWAQAIDDRFDMVVALGPQTAALARAARVAAPVVVLPVPLDLDGLLATPSAPPGRRLRFGSLTTFHPREGAWTLLDAFLQRHGDRPDEAELVLHSELVADPHLDGIRRRVVESGASNVSVACAALDDAARAALIGSLDVFASCSRAPGLAMGARQALALGKALLLSDTGGHRDLADLPGVFAIPADVSLPARDPDSGLGLAGRQHAVRVPATMAAMRAAFAFARSPAQAETLPLRREAARGFGFSRLTAPFAALVDTGIAPGDRPPQAPAVAAMVERHLGRHAGRIPHAHRRVVAAHDGGFFSIFNAYMNHLAWDRWEDRCHATLPDWDVDRLIARLGDTRVTSFCYGKPGDGNLWTRLFEPPRGFTDAELNDEASLYAQTDGVSIGIDSAREPWITDVHAYKLYHSRSFQAWRRQYHATFREHVHLRPELQAEIDGFAARHLRRPFLIAAHVRHPSHTVEQPNAEIAQTETYIRRIYQLLEQRGIDRAGDDWGVFLATDQERVVTRFRAEFGDRVACFDDVRRTRAAEDAAFEALSAEEQNQEGHQLQHLVAASRDQWSLSMAWEVVRDAYCMARCHALLHVVSNVSTAVAFMNPDLEMIFCSAE